MTRGPGSTGDAASANPDGARLPSGTRLGPARLLVADLQRSLGFYQGLLGLEPRGRSARRAGDEDARLLQWTLEPPEAADVEAVARRLEAAGHACAREGDDIVASDPWGTALRVRAPIATATPGG